MRPGVVVGTKKDSFLALRMPFNDDVGHRHLGAAEWIVCAESLHGDLTAQLLEKVLEQRLLFLHSSRAARPWSDRTKFQQIRIRPLCIQRIGWLHGDARRLR